MGWATNFLGLQAIMGKGTLIISDSLNHNSLAAGCRSSGAAIRVFKHNDLEGLESLVRSAIVDGQDRTHRAWKKILLVIEGIYSMEGEFCDLAPIVAIAKKYRCYVYLDEAHSIGATGRTGRGLCEHSGVDPRDVDILMGTFTKSFGAMGGYIAGSREFVAHVRAASAGFLVDNAMAPIVCQQVLTCFKILRGQDGTSVGARKVARLRDNSNYMRSRLIAMGLEVLGDRDSPIMPIMIYNPTKIAAFSRMCLERGLAVVVVGFPATPLVTSRARICMSAGHTREDIDVALGKIEEVADLLRLKYRKSPFG
jgi:serine palmitoyltransferase